MKKLLTLITLFLISGWATTDNLGDLSKRFDDIKKIERLCPEAKQTLLFSATMPYKVEQLANTILKSITLRSSFGQ